MDKEYYSVRLISYMFTPRKHVGFNHEAVALVSDTLSDLR